VSNQSSMRGIKMEDSKIRDILLGYIDSGKDISAEQIGSAYGVLPSSVLRVILMMQAEGKINIERSR
jgi:DNA-binding GntR family transcriptional regulator